MEHGVWNSRHPILPVRSQDRIIDPFSQVGRSKMRLYRNVMLALLSVPLFMFLMQTHDTEEQGLAAMKDGILWFWVIGLAAFVFHLAAKYEELHAQISQIPQKNRTVGQHESEISHLPVVQEPRQETKNLVSWQGGSAGYQKWSGGSSEGSAQTLLYRGDRDA